MAAVAQKPLFLKRFGDTGLPFPKENAANRGNLTFSKEIVTFLTPELTKSRQSRWEIFGRLLGSEMETDKETDRETDRETNRETDSETDENTDRGTDREAGREPDRKTDNATDRET